MRKNMKQKYRLYRRNLNGYYYIQDNLTRKQEGLGTRDRVEAHRLLHTRNEAASQPAMNLQIARAYLAAGDPKVASRTWQDVIAETTKNKTGLTRKKWESSMRNPALNELRTLRLMETRVEHFSKALETGRVGINISLRRLHAFAVDTGWLPWPVMSRKRWPKITTGDKRGLTADEHQRIVTAERDEEVRDFYELLWQVGGSQSDMAALTAENIDWANRTVSYARMKTGSIAIVRFNETLAVILQRRGNTGFVFPKLAKVNQTVRGRRFGRLVARLKISGVTLHSYRYAWAERAKTCGFPERFAQEALGHASKAVHRAYAKKAKVLIPPLDEYERKFQAAELSKTPPAALPLAA
jgi:site-specific recombinase XerD